MSYSEYSELGGSGRSSASGIGNHVLMGISEYCNCSLMIAKHVVIDVP
jgi:hypothetical protein